MKSNTAKVWIFFTLMCVIVLVVGFQIGGRHGLLAAFLFGVVLLSLLFFFGENDLIRYSKAQEWGGRDPWGIHDILNEFGASDVQVFVSEENHCFAFAHSRSFRKPGICVSVGLLSRLEQNELRAVIAFLVAMIERQDSFLFSMVSRLAQAILGVGFYFDSYLPRAIIHLFAGKNARNQNTYHWGPFSLLLSPMAWLIISLVTPHHNIYKADMGSAQLIKDRYLLALVIWKLDSISKSQDWSPLPGTSHLFFADPDGYLQLNPLFHFHPSSQSRIKRLLGYFPL